MRIFGLLAKNSGSINYQTSARSKQLQKKNRQKSSIGLAYDVDFHMKLEANEMSKKGLRIVRWAISEGLMVHRLDML